MKKLLFTAVLLFTFLMLTQSASAVTMLIGDVDGFGFTNPNAYESAQNSDPDTDGDGIIEEGEFLPDLDNDGSSHVNGHDEFDNRSAAEAASTDGAQWTDISLEDYYGDFGDAPADDAFFTFDFNFDLPELGDSDYGVVHYINLLFGDYDVTPMSISVDGTKIELTTQNNQTADGLVQLAYAEVAWENMLDGIVTIDIIAPNEPYIALDYAYLDTDHVAPPQNPVPEPTTIILLGSGLLGLFGARRKVKK